MAGGESLEQKTRELDATPTWAVASVCAVIILISILLEKALHSVGDVFRRKKQKHMVEALEKLKAELMILGFISLLFTFGQTYVAKLCIPERYANTMLPCKLEGETELEVEGGSGEHHRRLLWYERRMLSGGVAVKCKPGYAPLISVNGLHQLHIFIFFLAVFHVVFSVITMTLGRLKIRGWKEWEKETDTDQQFLNDPSRFRLTHETSFVKDHLHVGTRAPVIFYTICFFRQFYRSVRKADYMTMRHGFVTVHLAPGSKFNFQKYIRRSLEDDFKVVVGISPLLWLSAVSYLLLNVHGWGIMFYLSVMPLILILAIDTKLQAIITTMAIEIKERHAVVQGIPLVQVSDRNFWFGWPQLVLYLIHFVLFQNAFELTYVLWITYEFGIHSCFHGRLVKVILRVCLGILAQFVCSYITLPLYALVTQMGSTMKRSIFDDQTSKALKQWHKKAVQKTGEAKPAETPAIKLGGSPKQSSSSPSPGNARARPRSNNNSTEDALAVGSNAANAMANVDLTVQHRRSNEGYQDLL